MAGGTRIRVVRADLREAEWAIAQARRFAERFGHDSHLECFLCTMEGGVRRAAGDYPAAIALFQRAGALAARYGDEGAVVRAASLVAFCHSHQGEPGKAVMVLERVLPELEASQPHGRLRMALIGNLATAYTRLGRTLDARRLLPELEQLTAEAGEPLSTIRVSWIRGMIHHQDGQAAHAERFYRQVQTAFVEAGVPQDVALVSLDLAVLYLETDRPAKAAGVATWLIPVFRDLGIEKETLAAGLLLLRALERQQATVDAVRDYAKKLQQSPAWAG